jgi:hypothetical protein
MRDAASATPRAIWRALKDTFRREGENHGRKRQEDFSGYGRGGGRILSAVCRVVPFFEEPLLGATCAPCSPKVAAFSEMVASEGASAWMMAMRRFR